MSATRDKLIAAAFRVVARDGLDAASVKAIAAEAGVTPGLLHYHFPTKERLIADAMDVALADYLLRQSADTDLAGFFAQARGAAETDRDFFRMRLALAARALASPADAALMTRINRAATDATAAALARAEGEDAISDRHHVLATALKASFDGVMLASLIDPGFPLDDVVSFFEQSARRWLGGTDAR